MIHCITTLLYATTNATAVPEPVTAPYIVVMGDASASMEGYDARVEAWNTAERMGKLFSDSGSVVRHVYNASLYGFAATLPQQAVEHLKADPKVYSVEKDGVVSIDNSMWGLDRINQRRLPLDGTTSPDENAGEGAIVYVVDTGVAPRHDQFRSTASRTSRVIGGASFVQDGNGWYDCNGHGTHCASTVAGKTCGVAPQAKIISVRVLGCSGVGSYGDMIAGLDWIMRDVKRRGTTKAVVSMSLGGASSAAMDQAVDNVAASGVPVVVAAGNENKDACNYSPARARLAVSVASSDRRDRKSSFSNYGKCVDIVAPGSDIIGADFRSRSGLKSLSGTSMACPHVAGAIAAASRDRTSNDAQKAVMGMATPKIIQGLDAPLLYVSSSMTPLPIPSPTPPPQSTCTRQRIAVRFLGSTDNSTCRAQRTLTAKKGHGVQQRLMQTGGM